MNQRRKARNAKVRDHGHSSKIEGLTGIIDTLVRWEEISVVSVGSIKRHQASSGSDNKATLKVVGWTTTRKPPIKTGILCQVRAGSSIQLITLQGDNLDKLEERLLNDPSINAENLLRPIT